MTATYQPALFDGFVRETHCLRFRRRLHKDRQNAYRTRKLGLCFLCLRDYEQWPGWSLPAFIKTPVRNPGQRMLPDDMGPADGHRRGAVMVKYRCHRCGRKSRWLYARSISVARRGIPCPHCRESTR